VSPCERERRLVRRGSAVPQFQVAPWECLACFILSLAQDWAFLSSDVFAGMKIDPKTLVKQLDLDSRSVVSAQTGKGCSVGSDNCQSEHLSSVRDGEEKTLLSKREKMKLRKDRWLQKIEGVKLARLKQKAEAKRKATPVVGDMQPLMEALPELSELTTTSKTGGGSGTDVPDELGLAFPAERTPLVADSAELCRDRPGASFGSSQPLVEL
uniref:Family with sequence similarity 207 member A n=1 Tax=Chelydra serpentina TaxID=8475 RepID=A0A8C3SNE5_CHESE